MNNKSLPEDLQFQILWDRAVLLQVLYQLTQHMGCLSRAVPCSTAYVLPRHSLDVANLVKKGAATFISLAKRNNIFCLAVSGLSGSGLVLSCPAKTDLIAACTEKAVQNCGRALSQQLRL